MLYAIAMGQITNPCLRASGPNSGWVP